MFCLHKTTKLISVKKKQDFKKVYSQGVYAADSLFVAYALANDFNQNRLGITVSKKVGCAVVRNRIKRWVKESYRFMLQQRKKSEFDLSKNTNVKPKTDGQAIGYDFVIVARVSSAQLIGKGAFWQVDKSIRGLFERLRKKVEFIL